MLKQVQHDGGDFIDFRLAFMSYSAIMLATEEAAVDLQRQNEEVDRNYEAFKKVLASLLPDHRDQLALMRDERIVGFFDTARELLEAAHERFPDDIFSIQEVTDEPFYLGYLSDADHRVAT
jgi:hypothetical protein